MKICPFPLVLEPGECIKKAFMNSGGMWMYQGERQNKVASALECQKICQKDPKCQYFTYSRYNDTSRFAIAKPRNCYMSAVQNPTLIAANWSESAPKYCPGQNTYDKREIL